MALGFLALGLAGLFGARQLAQGISNTGYRNALPQIAGQLNQADQEVMRGLATGGPFGFGGNSKAAFDYAVLARARQDNEAWRTRQGELADARLDMQQQMMDLGRDRFDFDMQQYADARQLKADELLLLEQSLTNPQLAQALALKNKQGHFMQLVNGAVKQIPLQGTDAWNKPVATANVQASLINTFQEMLDLVQTTPGELTNPNSAVAGRFKALNASALADIKSAEELGALDQGVIEFAQLLAPDATGTIANFMQGGGMAEQLRTTLGRYQGKLRETIGVLEGFQGVGTQSQRAWAQALGYASTDNAAAVARTRAQEDQELPGLEGVRRGLQGLREIVVDPLQGILR